MIPAVAGRAIFRAYPRILARCTHTVLALHISAIGWTDTGAFPAEHPLTDPVPTSPTAVGLANVGTFTRLAKLVAALGAITGTSILGGSPVFTTDLFLTLAVTTHARLADRKGISLSVAVVIQAVAHFAGCPLHWIALRLFAVHTRRQKVFTYALSA